MLEVSLNLEKIFGSPRPLDATLILTDAGLNKILGSLNNIHRDKENFYNPIANVYLANEGVIEKYFIQLRNNGITLSSGWRRSHEYKSRLLETMLNARCFMIDMENENTLYKPALRGSDFEVVNRDRIYQLDLKPI